jgi:hypothetical protein
MFLVKLPLLLAHVLDALMRHLCRMTAAVQQICSFAIEELRPPNGM